MRDGVGVVESGYVQAAHGHMPDKNPIPPTPTTSVGVCASVVVPLPSSPFGLAPQQKTLPAEDNAHAHPVPTAMSTTLERRPEPPGPMTCTGVNESAEGAVMEPID